MARGGSDKEDKETDLTLCVNGVRQGEEGGNFTRTIRRRAATAAVLSDVAFINTVSHIWTVVTAPLPLEALAVLGHSANTLTADQSCVWLPVVQQILIKFYG